MIRCLIKALKNFFWADRKEKNHHEKTDIIITVHGLFNYWKKQVRIKKPENPSYGFPKELLERDIKSETEDNA